MEDYYDYTEDYGGYEDTGYEDYGGYDHWTYEAPGIEADPSYWNFENDGSDGWTVYEPGEYSPVDGADFSWGGADYPGGPPDQGQMDQAVLDAFGLQDLYGPDTAEAWTGEDGQEYTKDYAGNVFDAAGNFLGNDNPYQTTLGEEAQGGLYPGGFEGEEPPAAPAPRPAQARTPQPGPPNNQAILDQWARDIERIRTAATAAQAEKNRQFDVTQSGLNERANLEAQVSLRGQELQARNARESAAASRASAQSQREAAMEAAAAQRESAAERIAAEKAMQERGLTARQAEQERAQKVAIAQALLNLGTGPNGPANRRIALEILRSIGVNVVGGEGGQPGGATPPNMISPVVWDSLTDNAKQLLLDAWVAQGGDPREFIAGIDAQRPNRRVGGGAPTIRYAGVVA